MRRVNMRRLAASAIALCGCALLAAALVLGRPGLVNLANAAFLLVTLLLLVLVWRNVALSRVASETVADEVRASLRDLRRRAARLQDGVGTVRKRQRELSRQSRTRQAEATSALPAKAVSKVAADRALAFSTLDYWSRRNSVHSSALDWITRALVKHRSEEGRDLLAYAATGGEMDFRQLSLALGVSRSMDSVWVLRGEGRLGLQPGPAVALARVLYRQRMRTADLLDAISIYRTVLQDGETLAPVDCGYLVDALTACGFTDEAASGIGRFREELRKLGVESYLRSNVINPYLSGERTEEEWLEVFNADLTKAGLEPVQLREGNAPPFYRLHCETTSKVEDGPLVSVLMPVYEASDATDVAIASILAQTWSNLELIIVDDGSGEEFRERLRSWEGRDPRLHIIFNEENRGAYWARNTAYSRAAGEFVTVADKDDWHHPRKLEIQARDLLDNEDRLVNMTSWVRVDEKLRFLVRWGPMRIVHPSFASIFFRRKPVMDALGYWDNVRKSGDGEFKGRLQTVFGINLQPMSQVPMALSLLEDSNLTSNDLGLGFEHPNRTVYRKTYEQWHRRLAKSGSPYLPMDPPIRPFPAPREFLPERPEHPLFDIIFVSEFGFAGGSSRVLENEIAASLAAGLRVGIICMENLLISSAADRGPSYYVHSLILEGAVSRLALTDVAHAKLLLIRWPAIMQYTSGLTSGIKAERAVVIANHAPYEDSDRRYSYSPPDVIDNVTRMFGIRPTVAPESARVRRLLTPLLPVTALADRDWPGVLRKIPAMRLRKGPLGKKPVIGRHSRDAILKWPQREVLKQVYPMDRELQVRVLGGVESLLGAGVVSRQEIAAWEIHEFGALKPEEFLSGLDFFVYYHHPELVESYGMTIVEALAAGVVAILPEHFRPVFGDAAVYASPRQLRATVWKYWSDWSLYQEQVRRGYGYLQENVAPYAFLRRVEALGVRLPTAAEKEAAVC